MSDPASKILASRLGRLARPGSLGPWLVSRFLADNIGHAAFRVAQPPEAVRKKIQSLMESRGELLDPQEAQAAPDALVAVVGAGQMALNPTVVTVLVKGGEDGSSDVNVHAVAKEGWVKQRAGEEVARWIQAQLTEG